MQWETKSLVTILGISVGLAVALALLVVQSSQNRAAIESLSSENRRLLETAGFAQSDVQRQESSVTETYNVAGQLVSNEASAAENVESTEAPPSQYSGQTRSGDEGMFLAEQDVLSALETQTMEAFQSRYGALMEAMGLSDEVINSLAATYMHLATAQHTDPAQAIANNANILELGDAINPIGADEWLKNKLREILSPAERQQLESLQQQADIEKVRENYQATIAAEVPGISEESQTRIAELLSSELSFGPIYTSDETYALPNPSAIEAKRSELANARQNLAASVSYTDMVKLEGYFERQDQILELTAELMRDMESKLER